MKLRTAVFVIGLWAAGWTTLCAQEQPGPATALYRRLASVSLDSTRVYRIRDAHLEREDLHLSLNDGIIAFTQAVDGRITGAVFEGDGDVLVVPPDRVERWSLTQFTGAAILEERFSSAYLRFNDDVFAALKPWLRPFVGEEDAPSSDAEPEQDAEPEKTSEVPMATSPAAFLAKWNDTSRNLAALGALRLLNTFIDANSASSWQPPQDDHYLAVHLSGNRLGVFHVYFDSRAPEQILGAQSRSLNGLTHYNVWTSFPMRSARARMQAASASVKTQAAAEAYVDRVRIPRYSIKASILPPRSLQAEATLEVETDEPGHRMLVFELSRALNVKEVTLDGRRLEFVQNASVDGSELARRGNDLIAVIFPQALVPHQRVRLRFLYEGEVLSEAGGGLMYVGARGIWYPNRGFSMSSFDMEFRYPATWTLVATGKRVSASDREGGQVVRYVSERPMPVAGFNIGLYEQTEAKASKAVVRTYATREMEASFPQPQPTVIDAGPVGRKSHMPPTMSIMPPPPPPSPSHNAQQVADHTADTIDFLAERLGPFPYSSLAVTQIPGTISQSWPGLIYLSGHAFLSSDELAHAHLGPLADVLYRRLMPAHETAHQWWGDLLIWGSYREQWLIEALSNYCVLLMLEQRDPADVRAIMDEYRRELLLRKDGHALSDAGPVTLGVRLNSSRFPQAYERIAYGRGTWLFHMLRHMLVDANSLRCTQKPGSSGWRGCPTLVSPGVGEAGWGISGTSPGSRPRGSGAGPRPSSVDPFFAVLRQLRERFEGREITTRDVQQAFEQALPDSLRFDNRKSLEWFFDYWVNGTAVPDLELSQVKLTSRNGGTAANGHILQKHVPEGFVTSVPIYAEVSKGSLVLVGRVYAEGPDTPFRLTVPAGTKRVLLDPYQTVLRRQ